jgi:adenosylcobinamide-phosphate synthase
MIFSLQIVLALVLDALIGDPRWLYHPVRIVGFSAVKIELITRKIFSWQRGAGIVTAFLLLAGGGAVSWLLTEYAYKISPLFGAAVSGTLIYFSIAPRDLASHALDVYRALCKHDLVSARKKVAMIVGRDTKELDEVDISRATVETVAESIVDGVTAPLFYAFLLGPAGAMVYRISNTLDSMFGHKDERYFYFGWASARIDDVLNYVPARLTGPCIAIAALLCRKDFRLSIRTLIRDARKHHSPNSGFPESAVAGALRVQLGGVNYYNGERDEKPLIGTKLKELEKKDIQSSVQIMLITVLLFSAAGIVIRVLIEKAVLR